MGSNDKIAALNKAKRKSRKPGIEPGAQRWQRWILPLNHLRLYEMSTLRVGVVKSSLRKSMEPERRLTRVKECSRSSMQGVMSMTGACVEGSTVAFDRAERHSRTGMSVSWTFNRYISLALDNGGV
ncbi:hypothetical protein DIRU0_E34574 [Diutina rugosa]